MAIRRMLCEVGDDLESVSRSEQKELLRALLDKVRLDPASMECQIRYHITGTHKLASPRGIVPYASRIVLPFETAA